MPAHPHMPADRLDEHVKSVRAVAAAGATAPAEWEALVQRLADLSALDRPMQARLTSAIIDGDNKADVPDLFASALAEQALPTDVAKVLNAVRAVALARLHEIYAGVAQANYAAIAEQFNTAAKAFTAAAEYDPETSAVQIAHRASEKERKQWLASEQWANELTRLLPSLVGAATLANVKGLHRTELLLPLVCAPTDEHHRRQVWQAFEVDTRERRCGRWSALHALDVPIKACDKLDTLTEYRAPAPMGVKTIEIARGITRQEAFDPEDGPEPIDPRIHTGRMVAG
jgi:hypothetical protein